jgi:TrpR-related protein YerC/YecD
MVELGLNERTLLEKFHLFDPHEKELSDAHFRRLITTTGKRKPLVKGTREIFAKAFSVSLRNFEAYLRTGDMKIITKPEAQITVKEKVGIWSEVESSVICKPFLALSDEQELKCFFRDIMTENEIRELNKRWRVANMLHQGMTVPQIMKKTGLEEIMIERVDKWLRHGCGGYQMLIDRLDSVRRATV